MSTTYLKSDLITELAQGADIPKTKAEAVINQLAQIAYREASGQPCSNKIFAIACEWYC